MLGATAIETLVSAQGCLVLDGGLATELKRAGHDLDHPLWSARLLTTDPGAIRNVHSAYLQAGADCLIAASYHRMISFSQPCGAQRNALRLSAPGIMAYLWIRSSPGEPQSGLLVTTTVGPHFRSGSIIPF